jgi:hypothetical protein
VFFFFFFFFNIFIIVILGVHWDIYRFFLQFTTVEFTLSIIILYSPPFLCLFARWSYVFLPKNTCTSMFYVYACLYACVVCVRLHAPMCTYLVHACVKDIWSQCSCG